MSSGRDLYKTKLCHLYQRGRCHRQSCSFAHGESELRRSSNAGFNGRREFRGGDLRERLQKRHSPHSKRFSPGRDSRGHQDRGRSFSRSPIRGRPSRSLSPSDSGPHKRDKKRFRHDESHRRENSEDPKGHAISIDGSPGITMKSQSLDQIEPLEEEFQEIDMEIESLKRHLLDYESTLNDKTKDINNFSIKNSELDMKLHKEYEDIKRINAKLKKFVKLYLRRARAQEEVKKSQGRLEKLVDDLPSCDHPRFLPFGEDSDVNIVSDVEPNHAMGFRSIETIEDNDLEGKSHRLKSSQWNMTANGTHNVEGKQLNGHFRSEIGLDKFAKIAPSRAQDLPNKVRNWDPNVNLPSTGLAAHAEDEILENSDEQQGRINILSKGNASSSDLSGSLAEKVKLNGLQVSVAALSQMPMNQYAEYAGDDEEVDVEELDGEPCNNGMFLS